MRRKQVEIVSAREWQARLAQIDRMNAREQAEFREKRRLEISVQDLRDLTVGEVYAKFGQGPDAFHACYERGGAHPSTLASWDKELTHAPLMTTIRKTLIACGKDIGIVDL